jgi:FkbM family methyltransferase
MMFFAGVTRSLGNKLYETAFPIYQPLYSAYKSLADRAERRLAARELSAGDVVVDAGANIGVYSRFLSKCVGPNGVVHSFEPSPENFARLLGVTRNLRNVRANQLAVGEKTGEQLLYISGTLNVDHRTYPPEGESRRTLPVRSTRLDDYFEPKAHVDLIKLDIQGYELHALQGAKRVLSDNPAIKLLVEFWPFGLRAAGSSPQALLALLEQHGFSIFAFGKGGSNERILGEPYDFGEMSFFNIFARRVERGRRK